MTQEQYERIIRAALSMKRSKFAMAEALALDIPAKVEGDGQSVTAALEEVAAQIIDMGGDDIAVATLANYRTTAFWVKSVTGDRFQWREGSSFTAHQRAAKGGMSYEEFAKIPRTTRDIQKMLGQKVSSTQVKQAVEDMTQVEKIDMMRELAKDDLDSVTEVLVDQHKDKAAKKTKPTAPTPKDPTRSDALTTRWRALEAEIGSTVGYTNLITSRWARELDDLSDWLDNPTSIYKDARDIVSGHVDAIVEVFEAFNSEMEAGAK